MLIKPWALLALKCLLTGTFQWGRLIRPKIIDHFKCNKFWISISPLNRDLVFVEIPHNSCLKVGMTGQTSSAPPRPACWRRRRDTWSTLHWVCHVSSGNGGRHGYVGDDGGDDGCGEMTNRRRDPHCFSSLTLIWRETLSVFVLLLLDHLQCSRSDLKRL